MTWNDPPGSPVVRTLSAHWEGLASIPGWGTKIPQAVCGTAKQQQENKKEVKGMRTRLVSFYHDLI